MCKNCRDCKLSICPQNPSWQQAQVPVLLDQGWNNFLTKNGRINTIVAIQIKKGTLNQYHLFLPNNQKVLCVICEEGQDATDHSFVIPENFQPAYKGMLI